jgi:hypothetical protein
VGGSIADGGPYRTSQVAIPHNDCRVKSYKKEHENIEVSFTFKSRSGIGLCDKIMNFSPLPRLNNDDGKNDLKLPEHHSEPSVYESVDQLKCFLQTSYKEGMLQFGNLYIPWDSFLGAEVIKKVKTTIEFQWYDISTNDSGPGGNYEF